MTGGIIRHGNTVIAVYASTNLRGGNANRGYCNCTESILLIVIDNKAVREEDKDQKKTKGRASSRDSKKDQKKKKKKKKKKGRASSRESIALCCGLLSKGPKGTLAPRTRRFSRALWVTRGPRVAHPSRLSTCDGRFSRTLFTFQV
ncbi:hypothetical protein GW17_00018915 [Ensete ventricosum]|nr:hypothetical protein GW17_00018915 [Ensete ventricosum]